MKEKNVVIVAHKFATSPDDELVPFLNQNDFTNVMHIRHSFNEQPDRKSYYSWFRNGRLYKEDCSKDYLGWPEPFIYLKELYFTWKWVRSAKIMWSSYLGMDGLCTFFGNLLRRFSYVKKTIYWVIDFVPANRFKGKFKNRIYQWINTQGYKKADELWDISPRMIAAREKFLGLKERQI